MIIDSTILNDIELGEYFWSEHEEEKSESPHLEAEEEVPGSVR